MCTKTPRGTSANSQEHAILNVQEKCVNTQYDRKVHEIFDL